MLVAESFDQYQTEIRPKLWAAPVVTVGNFDGMHLGHQFLIYELLQWARELACPAVAVTFLAHPRSIVEQSVVRRITAPTTKLKLMQDLGLDAAIMVAFDDSIRSLEAREFCKSIVQGKLGARGLLLGHNNRIGRDRTGTPEALTGIGLDLGLEIRHASKVEIDGQSISSSAIRDHVSSGDFHWARKMLGRAYALGGRIAPGRRLGRTIGFPTLNLPLDGMVHPPMGVYGVLVTLSVDGKAIVGPHGGQWLGAANLGVRPTVETGRTAPLLEVHVLDEDGRGVPGLARDFRPAVGGADSGGTDSGATLEASGSIDIEVEFAFRVRDERRFESIDSLKAQLANDVALIRERFAQGNAGARISGRMGRVGE